MPKNKVAFITGITGQDGSYLAELLHKKGYNVHGLVRRSSTINTKRISHLINTNNKLPSVVKLHYGDLVDSCNLTSIISSIRPDEIYNLGAQSHVGLSFDSPEYTAETDALGPMRILEAVKSLGLKDKTRIYQASTSELYGLVQESPQNESTPFYPRSPYGVAKLYAYWITINYREAYDIYACNGILFNHESPRRGHDFVTRKITKGLSYINNGLNDCIFLGNINALRDWGHARDYVEMQWRMLQQEKPDDYVIATGEQISVRKFAELSAEYLNWGGIIWEGNGIDEIGRRKDNKEIVIRVDPNFYRPTEVESLIGDASKAHEKLGWKSKVKIEDLVKEMIEKDNKHAKRLATSNLRQKDLTKNQKILI